MVNSMKLCAPLWKRLVDFLSVIIEDGYFDFEPDGIHIRQCDPQKIVLIDYFLPKNEFQEYNCEVPGEKILNVSNIQKILRKTSKKDTLQLSLDKTRKTFSIEILKEDGSVRKFTIPTGGIGRLERPGIPKLSNKARVKLSSKPFLDAVQDAKEVSNEVLFKAKKPVFTVRSYGGVGWKSETTFPEGTDAVVSLNVEESQKALYSAIYLSDLMQGIVNFTDIIELCFSNNSILTMDACLIQGRLVVYLAQHIPKRRK